MPLSLSEQFSSLSTALVCDACLRLKFQFRLCPPEVRPVVQGEKVAGRVLPVRHYGSVDVFLEAMESAQEGDVMVIDNGGRMDEACVGDLTVLEAEASGLAGMVVWGCHRDTQELLKIGFPVYSLGAVTAGPSRLDLRESDALTMAEIDEFTVSKEDVGFADDDGVLFVSANQVGEVLEVARSISDVERRQADGVRRGKRLRDQLRFGEYLEKRRADRNYTFRMHLSSFGGAIEE